jgi:hypothetical protein
MIRAELRNSTVRMCPKFILLFARRFLRELMRLRDHFSPKIRSAALDDSVLSSADVVRSVTERPVPSRDESPTQHSLEDQFSGLCDLQERGR